MRNKVLTRFALAALLLAPLALSPAALAEGDPAAGEKLFKKCKTCHEVGAEAKNKVGPLLNGVAGSSAGSVEGYKYSDAFEAKKAEGLVWSDENLDAYLAKPKDFIPKTKMTFPGLRKEQERADMIAYLKQFQ